MFEYPQLNLPILVGVIEKTKISPDGVFLPKVSGKFLKYTAYRKTRVS
jgi:hypothetical protein